MNFVNIPLFNAMQEKLKYHGQRQAALAQNIANADVPKYKAMDIKSPDFGSMMSGSRASSAMMMTNPMHMQAGMNKKGGGGALRERENTYELNPIGNNVVLEEEVMNVGENQHEYQKMLSMYRKSIDMFKIALGKNGGA